ncbi:MAG: hypothetical protein NT077_03080 [Candidatus Taylorbacteria bacterium]|nr:hypothetical protein [Candidatus Taylorbacteria bacterium]
MSNPIEFQDEAAKRAEAIEQASELIFADELLKKDARTIELLKLNFIDEKGKVFDPGDWIADRRTQLVEDSLATADAAHLKNLREEDLANQHSKTWSDKEQNQ